MEILSPASLWWLGALPLLLIPYFIRERPRRRIVPAIFLFHGAAPARRFRVGGRLRLTRLFWLQLLILLLAVAALVRPALRTVTTRSAIVLDNSASLQAIGDGGRTRFAAAQERAHRILDADNSRLWDLYTLAPEPAALALGVDRDEALERIDGLAPGECGDPDPASLDALLTRLAAEAYESVHLLTDRRAEARGPFVVHGVGAPEENVAILALSATPRGFGAGRSEAQITVASFASGERRATVAIQGSGGERIEEREIDLAPGAVETLVFDVPDGSSYQARITPGDALAADDRREIGTRGGVRRVLVVGRAAEGLARLPGIRLEIVAPEEYRPERAAGQDLVIFHRSAPTDPPAAPALYLLPPPAPFLPRENGSVVAPALAFPDPTHPAVRYLNPGTLRPAKALTFAETSGWEALIVGPSGATVLERDGEYPTVVAGFDLLPFLGERNRPASILTLNLLSFLGAAQTQTAICAFGAEESDLREARALPLPDAVPLAARSENIERPLWPWLAASALVLLLLEGALQPAAVSRLPLIFRILILALIAAAVFDPMRGVAGEPRPPTLLIDQSASVLPEARGRRIEGVTFPVARTVVFGTADATNLEEALTAAAEGEDPGPLLVVTDGWETQGDTLRALPALRERSIPVYLLGVAQAPAGNVAVVRLSLPAQSRPGRAVRAEVLLHNDNGATARGRLVLRQGTRTLVGEGIALSPGDNLITRPVLVSGDGLLEYSARFEPADRSQNAITADDEAKAWLGVHGRRRVLLLGRGRGENRFLESALTQRGFAVEARSPSEGLGELSSFDALILNDLARRDLPRGAPESILAWVNGGGGLVMVGGTRGFGLGDWGGSPVEEALPVTAKPRERDEPRNAVALLVDRSGSMREERRIVYAKEAARQLVRRLDDRDRLTVIGFDRQAFTVIPLREVADVRASFEDRIARLRPAGGTRLFPALIEAQRELLGQEARRRYVIVLSDGLSEDAETAAGRRRYYDLALALAQDEITISTIALGRDADADFLERLASFGRGAFHQTDDPSNLPELVLGNLDRPGPERTLREETLSALPSRDSPLVGEIARSSPRWPPVLGLVETRLKPRARLDVTTPDGAPLIASWAFGRGRSVAVTTDADGRWSDRWVRWSEWSPLWGSILGWLAPEGEEQEATFAVGYSQGSIVVDYVRFDEDPSGEVTMTVTAPDGSRAAAPMDRIAPGHRRGRIPARVSGDHRIEIRGARGLVTRPALGFTLPPTLGAEIPRAEPNWSLLRTIAEATGGAVDPGPEAISARAVPDRQVPLAPWLLPLAMLLLIAELVLRRLAPASPG